MRVILAVFLLSGFSVKANTLEVFLKEFANKNGVISHFTTLIANGVLQKGISLEDRILVGKMQLSFEQAIYECIQKKECTSVKIFLHTPLPATPLRVKVDNVKAISGTDNLDINSILLARKKALTNYSNSDKIKILLSYDNDGSGSDEYKTNVSKSSIFIDCKGCYDVISGFNISSGAWYSVITKDNKKIIFVVNNTQLLEKTNSVISLNYKVNNN